MLLLLQYKTLPNISAARSHSISIAIFSMENGPMNNPRLDLNSPRVVLYNGKLRFFSFPFFTKIKFLPFKKMWGNIYLKMRWMNFRFEMIFRTTKTSFIQRSNKAGKKYWAKVKISFWEIFSFLIWLLFPLRLICLPRRYGLHAASFPYFVKDVMTRPY